MNNPIAKALGAAIIELMRMPVPNIVNCADSHDLMGRKELLERFAKIIDPVIYEVMSEAAEHSNDIDRSYYKTILSDAFEDRSVLSTLETAAEQLAEDESAAAERPLRYSFNPDTRRRITIT